MAISDFAYTLEFDTAKDGTWAQDESSRMIHAQIRRGREDALEPMRPGEMTLTMRNRDGRYWPDRGIISGWDNYVPVRLYATWTEPAAANLVDNPSLESDLVGWSGGCSRVATASRFGWACARLAAADGNSFDIIQRSGSRFAVTGGQPYVFAAWMRADVGSSNWRCSIVWYDGGGGFVGTSAGTLVALSAGGPWRRLVLAATAPATAATAFLLLTQDGSFAGTDVALADGGFFYQSSDIDVPYVDGDQPGCSWDGTAHQSTSARSANPTSLLFEGTLADIGGQEDHLDTTITLRCLDRLAYLGGIKGSLGLMLDKSPNLILHRLVDVAEGELISNPGIEWTAATANPRAGYTPYGTASLYPTEIPLTGEEALFLEGDWVLLVYGVYGIKSGVSYDATADIASVGKYRIVWSARVYPGYPDIMVELRLRTANPNAIIASTTVTLTQSWQRIELDADLTTLGTNRYIDMLLANTGSDRYWLVDALHAVPFAQTISRDFDAGAATLHLVTAYHEALGAVMADVAESEPGLLFVRGGDLADGGKLAFRDRNSRPSTAIPRATFGDGGGLRQFGEGLGVPFLGADRVASVTVTSRGSYSLGGGGIVWEMAPVRTTATGEEFLARYRQPARHVTALMKGAAQIEHASKNWGSGHDIEVTQGAADTWVYVQGAPYDRTTEDSAVTKRASGSLPISNHLAVQMPLQGTSTQAMDDEAQRLLDKYSERVARLRMPLGRSDDLDEMTAWQFGLDLNDLVAVQADQQDHAPGFRKKMWVEGIEHEISHDRLPATMVKLEEM